MDYEALLTDNLNLIESIVRRIARNHRLSSQDADDLGGAIRLKLIENDYHVLREYKGRSSLGAYLRAVISRFYLDRRNHDWGKWRPSLAAKQSGEHAVIFERLLTRENRPFAEAVEILRTNHGCDLSDRELYELSMRFPARQRRYESGEDDLALLPFPGASADEVVAMAERGRQIAALSDGFKAAVDRLAPEDQLILRMRYVQGIRIARIAKLVGRDAKPLYRHLDRILKALRSDLESQGFTRDDARGLTGKVDQEIAEVLGVPEHDSDGES